MGNLIFPSVPPVRKKVKCSRFDHALVYGVPILGFAGFVHCPVSPLFLLLSLDCTMSPIVFHLDSSMSLRSNLDRFCGLSPMDSDHRPRQRSRSPQRVHAPPGFRLSPFFAPPGWQPPLPRPDRAVILQIDLRPMQQLALLDNYYDILAPQVYTHLSTQEYRSAFILYKIIYPNYVSRHYVQELYELVVDNFLKRWSLHLRASQLILTIATTQGKYELNHMRTSILDVLQHVFPRWQTYQTLAPPESTEGSTSSEVPHGTSDATAFILNITCEPTAPSANLNSAFESSSH